MISRERFAAGLHEIIYVEEGMVTMLANFAKVMVAHTEGMDEGKKKKMTDLLTIIYNDSTRHKKIIDSMMHEVERGTRNEY